MNSVVVDVTLQDFLLLLRTHASCPELVSALMARLQAYAPLIDEQATAFDWAKESDRNVVAALVVAALTRRSTSEALPAFCSAFPFETRVRIYLEVLVLRGLMDYVSHEAADPLDRARTWMELYSLSRLGMREFKRRAEQHVGFHAAGLLLERYVTESTPTSPMAEQAVGKLQTAAYVSAASNKARGRMTSDEWRDLIARRLKMKPAEAVQELTSQLWLTLDSEWGNDPPLALLASAFGGNLDFVGLAIYRDLQDALKAEARYRGDDRCGDPDADSPREQLEILLAERSQSGAVLDPTGLVNPPAPPDEVARLVELIRRVEADPDRREFAGRALAGPDSQRELAKDLGVHESTITKRKRRLIE